MSLETQESERENGMEDANAQKENDVVHSEEEAAESSSPQQAPASLKKNAIYNLISKLLTLLIPLITTPYLARILGEEGNGQISYVSSIITYFTLAASLGFSVYGQREIAKYRNGITEKSIVFWEVFIMKLLCTILSFAVLITLIFTVGFGSRYNQLMLIMSLQVVAVLFDIEFLYMGEENFKSIALRNIAIKAIGVALIFIFVKDSGDVWVYALYLSLTSVVSYFVMWMGLFRHVKFVSIKKLFPWRRLKASLIIFIPLVITTLFTTFDKTMIGLLSPNPDYDNGCYEQAYKLNSVAQTFVTVFSSVLMARNASDYKNGNIESMNRHMFKTGRYVLLTSLFFVVGFGVLSENFCSWFLGDGYVEVPMLLQIMSIRLVVSGYSVAFGDRFIAMGKEKLWLIAVSAGAVANIGINYLMIPVYGAIGAAIATAACEVMSLIVMCILTFRKHGLPWKPFVFPIWKYLIAAAASFGIMFLMQYYLVKAVWSFIVIGLVGAIVYAGLLIVMRDSFFTELIQMLFRKIFKRKHQEEQK